MSIIKDLYLIMKSKSTVPSDRFDSALNAYVKYLPFELINLILFSLFVYTDLIMVADTCNTYLSLYEISDAFSHYNEASSSFVTFWQASFSIYYWLFYGTTALWILSYVVNLIAGKRWRACRKELEVATHGQSAQIEV